MRIAFCELSDEEVAALAKTGNEEAYNHIMIRYRNFVYAKLRPYYLAGADRDDLFQEGMIGLYKAVRDFNPKKSSFRAFAGVCVRRQILTAVKSALRHKHAPLNSYVSLDQKQEHESSGEELFSKSADRPQNPESILIERENLNGIEETINRTLSKLELQVLAYYLEGLSYQQIAEKIGKTPKAADNAIQRIRKKVENILTERK